MSDKFARAVGNGFIAVKDAKKNNGDHFIRIDHITAIRPKWNENDEWVRTDLQTLDGSMRSVNASFEQIMDAMTDEQNSAKA